MESKQREGTEEKEGREAIDMRKREWREVKGWEGKDLCVWMGVW